MSERKVLNVPTQEPMTPPTDTMPMDNNGMDAQFGGVSADQQPMDGGQENFEADFDAGVEANEEDDPKKFIQQLTGKLSQSLRKYNQNLPQPDAELSKYVAGMVLKQALEGLSQKDVSDIMDKVDTDADEQDMADAEQQEQQPEMQQEPMPQQQQAPMNETTGSPLNPSDKKPTFQKMRKSGYNRKPYRTTI